MYRVLHVYTANAPSSYTEAASHATASGSHSSVGLVRLISPFPRFSSCLLLPLPLLFPIFPIHRGRKKNIKKSAARLPAYSDSPGATAGPIAAAEQNSASAQRRMENSTEISPLSRFLFLLTGGQPAFPRTDIPVRQPRYPMARHPLRRPPAEGWEKWGEHMRSGRSKPTLRSTMHSNGAGILTILTSMPCLGEQEEEKEEPLHA